MHEVLQYMTDRTQEMLDMLKTIVEFESPSTDKAATDRLSAYLRDRFAELPGARAETIPIKEYGNHVRIEWGSGEQQLLVLCHMDTVWAVGEIASRPFRVEAGKAYGPGVMDMKSGIVHTYFALKALNEMARKANKKVVVILNTDEEVGSRTSRAIIEAEALKSTHVLVLEPSVDLGAIKTFRKGGGGFQIEITGKAAHAGGDPEKGISAVQELAHQILKLHSMTNFETGTTVNVGVVTAGTRPNVIAAQAKASVDVRVKTMAEAERVMAEILNLRPVMQGTTIKVTGGLNRPPMERTPKIVETYLKARALAAELGFDLPEAGTGGGSDGNFTAALGVPTLDGLGAVGEGGHALHEYIVIKDMPERAALLARLIETL